MHFGCTRFQMYLLGKQFSLFTDHQPLVSLMNNPRKDPPFRVERIRLKLQGFDFHVCYLPGKDNPSDYAPRHPVSTCSKKENRISGELASYVHRVILSDRLLIKMTIISTILNLLLNGRYPNTDAKLPAPVVNIWSELSAEDGLLLRQEKLVIPSSLQDRVIQAAHEGHLVTTERLLRRNN